MYSPEFVEWVEEQRSEGGVRGFELGSGLVGRCPDAQLAEGGQGTLSVLDNEIESDFVHCASHSLALRSIGNREEVVEEAVHVDERSCFVRAVFGE